MPVQSPDFGGPVFLFPVFAAVSRPDGDNQKLEVVIVPWLWSVTAAYDLAPLGWTEEII